MSFWKRNDPPPPAPAAADPEPEKTSVELLAESVKLLKQSLKMEAAERIAPMQSAHDANEARLAAAQETADTLGLREALANCVDRLAHHHAWIKQSDKYRTPGDGIYIVDGSTKKIDRTDHIGLFLTVDERPYVLMWERTQGYHSSGVYGSARFCTEQQEPLFAMDFSTSYAYDMERIHPGVVTKLELGEWVHDLIRLSERLTAGHERQMLEFRAGIAAEKAKDV